MPAAVQIYGKDGCPYTAAARKDYESRGVAYDYFDVVRDPKAMATFLELSGGERRVPLIAERGRVSLGFGGS
ncbi:MAG TPA: UXX-star (seleno)protein family 1 [Anaeromyxobacter sp.]|nr:UXX-star (seleno)protein family 1 [Anaeromyxobacter sp.]